MSISGEHTSRPDSPRARTVLVTGAGAGIGRALVEILVDEQRSGAPRNRVYAGVRNVERAQSDYAALLDRSNLHIVKLDVDRPEDATAVLAKIHGENDGRLDVLVNNAGYGYYGAFEDLNENEFRKQFETNFFGAMRLCRAALPSMRSAGHGTIVNVSSILGRLVLPTGTAYSSSKWALEAFSEALRYEVLPYNVKVVLIEPGLTRTNFKVNTQVPEDARDTGSPYAYLNREIGGEYSGYYVSAETAARRITAILNKRRPALRYRIGWDAILANRLRRVLPEAAFDWIFRFSVGRRYRQYVRNKTR